MCHPERVAHQGYTFENSIALIPRGGCSFAEKVYFAQLLGAKAAMAFHAHSFFSDEVVIERLPEKEEREEEKE